MLGAIFGDIVGSVYDLDNIKTKDFPLFAARTVEYLNIVIEPHFTDDSVMTIAVAQGLLDGGTPEAFVNAMHQFGAIFPDAGYGGRFSDWLRNGQLMPYNSWGNGSAMRVSPCAWYANSLVEAEQLAEVSAAVTHNHPEGIKGAQAIAGCIYLARQRPRVSKAEIRQYATDKYSYDLSKSLEEIRPNYEFDVSCQGSVPPAIQAFLESVDFEDAIRNAISLGGDSDTIGAMTGSIAEAYYGMTVQQQAEVFRRLDPRLTKVLIEWDKAGLPLVVV